ncbi:uncharacterized protein TM35_000292260 [Trypanosoma theileri]|uniref:Uncharacterized protein n=1 Tax=Trypanosoma theileri TaxID=67003 RepID=A0A1X0NNR4_9TRYP|nr:uncharacterized protein TM35_000292260 [Trypanosoma theileri]ORC86344.1 hypothetical protein TM35_000292260 [Trypanosoma theileri]
MQEQQQQQQSPLVTEPAHAPSQTSPPSSEEKRIEYNVRGPSVSPYFTLRIAIQAAPVPPLPSLQPQLKQQQERSNLWEESSSSLRHRWRFIKKEELELVRPSYDTTGPALELGKEDQLLPILLQQQQQQQQQKEATAAAVTRTRSESPQMTPAGMINRRAKSEGTTRSLSSRSRSPRREFGWLEEVLQDEKTHTTPPLLPPSPPSPPLTTAEKTPPPPLPLLHTPQGQLSSSPSSNNNNNNSYLLQFHTNSSGAADQSPGTISFTSAILPKSTTQIGGRGDTTVGDRTATSLEATTNTTASDAAQRLRVTLLTNSFQRMVDDVVETHGYSGEERLQLLRHAGIFRELSLQSRYHEMHPLCNIRVVGSEFRSGRRRTLSAPGSGGGPRSKYQQYKQQSQQQQKQQEAQGDDNDHYDNYDDGSHLEFTTTSCITGVEADGTVGTLSEVAPEERKGEGEVVPML